MTRLALTLAPTSLPRALTRLALATAPFLLGLVACESVNDQSEPAIHRCEYTDTAVLPDDVVLGTTPQEVADALAPRSEHAALWTDGTETTATLDLTMDLAGALLRESPGCGDVLQIPGTATLSTADGGITSLAVDFDLEWTDEGSARAYAWLEPSDVNGTWSPRPLDPNESRRGLSLVLDLSKGGALTGQLNDETEGEDGQIAWAASEPILELDEGFPVP